MLKHCQAREVTLGRAKLVTNRKLIAINMLEKEVLPHKTSTIIEYSSGSTVISMSMVSRIYHGIRDTRAYLSNKTTDAKLKLMQFFGLQM